MKPMTRTLSAAALLAAGIAAAGANAADLRLKARTGTVDPGRPSAPGVLKGTVPTLPDLVVLPMNGNTIGLPNTGVCGPWNAGYTTVKFKVKNQGAGASDGASFLLILQKNGQYVGGGVFQVPGLAPGQTTTVSYPVPDAAQPGYHEAFKAIGRVDAPNYIPETVEHNNWHTGICIGPAT